MKLRIIEIINTPNAIIQKFGLQVFEVVSSEIEKNPNSLIELSFDGLKYVTTGFCNASIGNLYQKFGESLEDRLKLTDINNGSWKETVTDAKELGLNPEKARKIDLVISDLFE